jgi:ketosteroid isomerase-like protein
MMSQNSILVNRLMACWNSGNLDALDEILTRDFVRHGNHLEGKKEVRGAAEYKQIVSEYHKLLSEFHSEVHDFIEQGDKAAFRFRTTGKKDGKPIEFEGANIIRIEGNRIAEDWVFFDATGLAARLGKERRAA